MAITTVQQVMMRMIMGMMMIMMTMMINIIITRQITFATLKSSVTHCWSFVRTSSRFHRWSIITIVMQFGDNFGDNFGMQSLLKGLIDGLIVNYCAPSEMIICW